MKSWLLTNYLKKYFEREYLTYWQQASSIMGETKPQVVQAGSMIMFALILSYIIISQQKASRNVAFGHEASYIALIGFLISLGAYCSNNNMI